MKEHKPMRFKLILFVTILIIFNKPLYAFDKWSKQDVVLQEIDTVFQVIDWLQTREIATNEDYYEAKLASKFIGSHPSTKAVDVYFLGTLLAKIGITHILPSKYRTYWQAGTIGLELYCVQHNYSIGIRIKF